MKKYVCLSIVLSISMILSGCQAFYDYCIDWVLINQNETPLNYANTIWICEEPFVWFRIYQGRAASDGIAYYQDQKIAIEVLASGIEREIAFFPDEDRDESELYASDPAVLFLASYTPKPKENKIIVFPKNDEHYKDEIFNENFEEMVFVCYSIEEGEKIIEDFQSGNSYN